MRILALFFSLVALARAATSYTGEPGLFSVETMKVEWRDTKRERDVPAKIYFPKNVTNPCAVIVFSHGLGGTRDGYEYLGRHWASHGFVSVHVQHHGSDDAVWRGAARTMDSMRKAALDPLNAINRPIDVSFAIDQLKTLDRGNGPLHGKLDLDRIGVAGHSFGAWTTLATAGERFGPNDKSFPDERVKAAIAMSAPVPRQPAQQQFSAITIPVLHMTGTIDNSPVGDTAAKDRRVPFDLMTHATEYLVTFEGGDHMIFSGPLGRGGAAGKRGTMHELIKAGTTAFWDAFLRGDPTAKEWLAGGGYEKALGATAKFEKKIPAAPAAGRDAPQ